MRHLVAGRCRPRRRGRGRLRPAALGRARRAATSTRFPRRRTPRALRDILGRWGRNGGYPGDSTRARIRGTSLAAHPDAVALARGSARLGPAGAAGHRRCCGGRVRLGNGRGQCRAVLRCGRPQHGGKLARFHLRGVRSSRDRHRRQAARRAVAAGSVAAGLRLSHLGAGPAAGRRGRGNHRGAVPGGPQAGRACGRPDRRGRARRHAHHRAAEPRQRVGLAVDPAARARRRRHVRRAGFRVAAAAAARRRLGRPGVPGEDDPGLAGPARAGRRLPARRARGAAAHPVRARGAGRAGHRCGVPVLDDGRRAGPVPAAALRGRQCRRLGVHPGLRLQRPGPGSPGTGRASPGRLRRLWPRRKRAASC